MTLLQIPLLVHRYTKSKKEIAKIKNLNTQLEPLHLQNTRLLKNRLELLKTIPQNATVMEVGVAEGHFSSKILEIANPSTLHLVDYWKKNRFGDGYSPSNLFKRIKGLKNGLEPFEEIQKRFQNEIAGNKVILHRGYSFDVMPTMKAASFDWIYIDAAHDFTSVLKDLECAHVLLKDDGILAGHDYVKWGRFGFKCGVVEAVNLFCLKYNYELLYLTLDAKTNSSFAIKKLPQ